MERRGPLDQGITHSSKRTIIDNHFQLQHVKSVQFGDGGGGGGTVFKSGGRPVATRGVMADTGADVAYAGGTPVGSSIRQLKILPSG